MMKVPLTFTLRGLKEQGLFAQRVSQSAKVCLLFTEISQFCINHNQEKF